jgi:hypothetical protein
MSVPYISFFHGLEPIATKGAIRVVFYPTSTALCVYKLMEGREDVGLGVFLCHFDKAAQCMPIPYSILSFPASGKLKKYCTLLDLIGKC